MTKRHTPDERAAMAISGLVLLAVLVALVGGVLYLAGVR
jgi:hypothetical protein